MIRTMVRQVGNKQTISPDYLDCSFRTDVTMYLDKHCLYFNHSLHTLTKQ